MRKVVLFTVALLFAAQFLSDSSSFISKAQSTLSEPSWAAPNVTFLYGWLLFEYFPTNQLNSTISHMEQHFQLSMYNCTPTLFVDSLLNFTVISTNSQQAEIQLTLGYIDLNITWGMSVTWNYTWSDHKWWSEGYSFDYLPIYVPPVQLSGSLLIPFGCYQAYKVVSVDNVTGRTVHDYYQKDTGVLLLRISYLIDQSGVDLIVFWLISTDVTFQETSSVNVDGQAFTILVQSNSNVLNMTIDKEQKKISFTVEGFTGTEGICNVTIPKELLNAAPNEWMVLVDNQPPTILIITWNSTHTFIYFTYTHSAHTVEITGTQVIPEFPSTLTALAIFMLTTLIATIFKNKKKTHFLNFSTFNLMHSFSHRLLNIQCE